MANGIINNSKYGIDDINWNIIETNYGQVLYMKRDGIVTVLGRNLTIPNETLISLYTLPAGYRSVSQIVGQLTYTDSAKIFGYYSIGTAGQVHVSNRSGEAGTHIWFNVTYPATA